MYPGVSSGCKFKEIDIQLNGNLLVHDLVIIFYVLVYGLRVHCRCTCILKIPMVPRIYVHLKQPDVEKNNAKLTRGSKMSSTFSKDEEVGKLFSSYLFLVIIRICVASGP